MFTIHADLRVTRRKLFHVVADASGAPVFRHRQIGDCLAWAAREGQDEITIICDPEQDGAQNAEYRVQLRPEQREG